MRFKKHLNEGTSGDYGPLSDITKQAAKNFIRKHTQKHTHNKLYKDDYWQGPQAIWKTFDTLKINWHVTKSEYYHDRDAKSATMPIGKKWEFSVFMRDKKGKEQVLKGNLTAAGAGSVKDPLDRYDLVLIMW